MLVKMIVDEDFNNYMKPSMMIATCKCNWKCCVEQGLDISICQNSSIAQQKDIDIPVNEIFNRYISNPITKAVVIGGLEPILQFNEVLELIKYFREQKCNDNIVIYTGYYPNEIETQIKQLKEFKNIIVKFGRFIPNSEKRYDEILGITLASKNQYAERIS